MREYTIQYLLDMEWFRITAVYDDFDGALQHGKDLLSMGHICRVLGRTKNIRIPSEPFAWYTIKSGVDNRIELDNPVYTCPR